MLVYPLKLGPGSSAITVIPIDFLFGPQTPRWTFSKDLCLSSGLFQDQGEWEPSDVLEAMGITPKTEKQKDSLSVLIAPP